MKLAELDASEIRRAVAVVVAVAAGVLVVNILLALLIARRSKQITHSLDRIRENAAPFFDVPEINSSLSEMAASLREMRTGGER